MAEMAHYRKSPLWEGAESECPGLSNWIRYRLLKVCPGVESVCELENYMDIVLNYVDEYCDEIGDDSDEAINAAIQEAGYLSFLE